MATLCRHNLLLSCCNITVHPASKAGDKVSLLCCPQLSRSVVLKRVKWDGCSSSSISSLQLYISFLLTQLEKLWSEFCHLAQGCCDQVWQKGTIWQPCLFLFPAYSLFWELCPMFKLSEVAKFCLKNLSILLIRFFLSFLLIFFLLPFLIQK
jgi:hypothetical protein